MARYLVLNVSPNSKGDGFESHHIFVVEIPGYLTYHQVINAKETFWLTVQECTHKCFPKLL